MNDRPTGWLTDELASFGRRLGDLAAPVRVRRELTAAERQQRCTAAAKARLERSRRRMAARSRARNRR